MPYAGAEEIKGVTRFWDMRGKKVQKLYTGMVVFSMRDNPWISS